MINRASVQLWGKAGQSAGPPKSAGKKSDWYPDCDPDRDRDRDRGRDTDRDRDRDTDRDPEGAILKKMAISFKENALRVADFSWWGRS